MAYKGTEIQKSAGLRLLQMVGRLDFLRTGGTFLRSDGAFRSYISKNG
ncbi:MAG TPA: hypothetical protein VEJ84_19420 [Acidimicrobiales bacterium]|nr:hypothetical protein [Acidimicrobiales bacterium]